MLTHERKLALVAFIWGINYLILPFGVKEFNAGAFTLLRFGLTLPILFLLLWQRNNLAIDRRDIPLLVCIGILGTTGYQATFAASVQYTTAANAAILFSLSPIFSMILGRILKQDFPAPRNWFGMLLAFSGGVTLIFSRGQNVDFSSQHLKGDLLMLAAALFWAVCALVSAPALKKYGGLKVTAWSLPSGVLGLLLFSGHDLWQISFSAMPLSAWLSLAFAILGATVIGVVLFYDAIPHLGTRKVMSYMYLIPVIAIISAGLVHRTGLNAQQLIGIMMAMVGVFLAGQKKAALDIPAIPPRPSPLQE